MDPSANLVLAWLWILFGFGSGLILGSFFHRENWLGGYGSFKRRMYRLAHISFFGLGAVNLLFWLTARNFPFSERYTSWASWGFFIGTISMPVCCLLMAHWPKARFLFAIPVLSLIAAGIVTLASVVHAEGAPSTARFGSTQNPIEYSGNLVVPGSHTFLISVRE